MNCTLCGREVEPEVFGDDKRGDHRTGHWLHADPGVEENADHHAVPESYDLPAGGRWSVMTRPRGLIEGGGS